MKLKVIEKTFSVCKLKDLNEINFEDDFLFIGKTDEELSLVCQTESVPIHTVEREDGWRAFRIEGVLDFSLIGILSRITAVLAQQKIGVFAVSTYNTDTILVKDENFGNALDALSRAGYEII